MFSKKILYVLSALGLSLFFAWSRIHVIELGYEVTRLKEIIEKGRQANGLLKTELADKVSTGKLAQMAKKYGMMPPTTSQVFFIGE